MLDRTAEFARSSNGYPVVTPIPAETLRQAARHLTGRKRAAVVAVADYLSDGSLERPSQAKSDRLQNLIDAFVQNGIAGVLRKSVPHHPSRKPLRVDYDTAQIRDLLDAASEDALRERLEVALMAYKGVQPSKIAKRIGKSEQIVLGHLKDFDAFGHYDIDNVPLPKIEASAEVLRAVAAATNVSFTSKRAIAVAMWVEGYDVSGIAKSFGVKTESVMAWLKLFERIGLESLYPARRLELTNGRSKAVLKASRTTIAKRRESPVLPTVAETRGPVLVSAPEVPADPPEADDHAEPTIVAEPDVFDLARSINLADLAVEAKMTKSYPVKIRLNAISQVARGTEIKVVAKRAKAKPIAVTDWVRLYVEGGLKAILV